MPRVKTFALFQPSAESFRDAPSCATVFCGDVFVDVHDVLQLSDDAGNDPLESIFGYAEAGHLEASFCGEVTGVVFPEFPKLWSRRKVGVDQLSERQVNDYASEYLAYVSVSGVLCFHGVLFCVSSITLPARLNKSTPISNYFQSFFWRCQSVS